MWKDNNRIQLSNVFILIDLCKRKHYNVSRYTKCLITEVLWTLTFFTLFKKLNKW